MSRACPIGWHPKPARASEMKNEAGAPVEEEAVEDEGSGRVRRFGQPSRGSAPRGGRAGAAYPVAVLSGHQKRTGVELRGKKIERV